MNKKQETMNKTISHKPSAISHQHPLVIRAVSPVLRQSARKLRFVARALRDLDPAGALEQLPFIVKRASNPIGKTIRQAVANATNNLKIPEKELGAMAIEILEGSTMKRYRAGPRGMAKPIKKRTSRIVVQLFVENNEQKTMNRKQ